MGSEKGILHIVKNKKPKPQHNLQQVRECKYHQVPKIIFTVEKDLYINDSHHITSFL